MKSGLSTSWFSNSMPSAEEILERCRSAGFSYLELNYNVDGATYDRIRSIMGEWGISILSLHAVCPIPRENCEFLISSEDENERKTAVGQIQSTIQRAEEAGAEAVVVHAGRVQIEEGLIHLKPLFDSGNLKTAKGAEIVNELRVTRLNNRGTTFTSLFKSLEEINREAEKRNVWIGLENRYNMSEYPNFEEFGVIFNRFGGSKLRYWHDMGHAQVQENLGIYKHKLMLDTYSEYMIGTHLHDVQNGYQDHFQPGCGNVNFEMVKPYIPEDAIRIVELAPRVTLEEGLTGIGFLREKGML